VSEQNIELLRRTVEAFKARDIDALTALFDPQAELHSVITTPGGAVYHGHNGLRRYLRDLEDAWEGEFHVEPQAYFDLGEHTLGFFVVRGRGRVSGAEVAMSNTLVTRWRDGLQVYAKFYLDREEALRDLGVSEDELKEIAP
jgi:ketosteroid isomerase-like protein